MFRLTMTSLTMLALFAVGCGDKDAPSESSGNETSAAWLLDDKPADAVNVAEAKTSAREGDKIVVLGRIGGRHDPIAEQDAVFTIMDLSVSHCAQIEGDACKTPWDYCCETPASIKANAATVKVVDADGKTVTSSPKAHGFEPLDEVILVGTVGPRPSDDVLVIEATGVHRVER